MSAPARVPDVDLESIVAARKRLAPTLPPTPLVQLSVEDAPCEIWLKLENLQPIGSFKLRGAGNAMAVAGEEALAGGVFTASAGNMAQGVAWNARRLGVPCSVVVPDHAPRAKLDAIERLGGRSIPVSFDEWWQVLVDHRFPGLVGKFIHPVSDPNVIAGNGTIGLEILEQLPDVDTVVVPYGGGGLSSGIATAVKGLKEDVQVLAAEVATAAPLTAALEAGHPVEIEYNVSFVDGIGGKTVLQEMWPLVSLLLDGARLVSLRQIADAVRTLALRNQVVAEGAGAASVATALSGQAGDGKVVCVVSGGNIDPVKLARILEGQIP